MTTWFVGRHAGARAWLREHGYTVDRCMTHLDPLIIGPGDTVVGTLPVHLAAEVCERGACYLHLVIPMTPSDRGRELTAADLRARGTRVHGYFVKSLGGV